MAGENSFQELGNLHGALRELTHMLPTRPLQEFQQALNEIEIQSGQNSSAFNAVTRDLKELTRATTISRGEFAHFTAGYLSSVNQLSLSLNNFKNLAIATNRIDPFNTDKRVASLLQYANQYGQIVNNLFASYDKESRKITDLNSAYALREVMYAKGNYAMAGYIEQLARGATAADNFATKSERLSQALKNARLSLATGISNTAGVSSIMNYFSTPTGASILNIAGMVGVGTTLGSLGRAFGHRASADTTDAAASVASNVATYVPAGGWMSRAKNVVSKIGWTKFGSAAASTALYGFQMGGAENFEEADSAAGGAIGSLGHLYGPLVGTITSSLGAIIGGKIGRWEDKKNGIGGITQATIDSEKVQSRLNRQTDRLSDSFAKLAVATKANLDFITEKYNNPMIEAGARRANIAANIAYQNTLVGTGQVPIANLIGLQRGMVRSIGDEIAEKEALRSQYRAGMSGKEAAQVYLDSKHVKSPSQLSAPELKELRNIQNSTNATASVAGQLTIDTEIAKLKQQQVEAMHLVRRTYMEQFTGQAMGLANGTYTMPSMMSDRQKYGSHYINSSGAAGFLPLTRADIANRDIQQRYKDRWGIQWAGQQGNPISIAAAGAIGGGSGNVHTVVSSSISHAPNVFENHQTAEAGNFFSWASAHDKKAKFGLGPLVSASPLFTAKDANGFGNGFTSESTWRDMFAQHGGAPETPKVGKGAWTTTHNDQGPTKESTAKAQLEELRKIAAGIARLPAAWASQLTNLTT